MEDGHANIETSEDGEENTHRDQADGHRQKSRLEATTSLQRGHGEAPQANTYCAVQ
jgi:hypothetical protein